MMAGLVAVLSAVGADKKPGPAQSGNDVVELIAAAHVGRQESNALLGHDPGFEMIVIDVRVIPKWDNKLRVYHDDFTLLSNKDGQRSQPLAPSQIAGRGAMVVSSKSGGGIAAGPSIGMGGPIYGGTVGRPGRLGGDGGMIGNTSQTSAQATIQTGAAEKENPLLGTLKSKILREGEIAEESRGLLYFIFDGKHKLKDLDLLYKSPGGKVIVDFLR